LLFGPFHSGKVNEQEVLETAQSDRACTRSSSGSQRLTRDMSSASFKAGYRTPRGPCHTEVVPGVKVSVQGCVCVYRVSELVSVYVGVCEWSRMEKKVH